MMPPIVHYALKNNEDDFTSSLQMMVGDNANAIDEMHRYNLYLESLYMVSN